MDKSSKIMLVLGFMGLVPFAAGIGFALTGGELFGLNGNDLFATYSVVILSFLSGLLWGAAVMQKGGTRGRVALVISNVFALFAWVAWLTHIGGGELTIALLGGGFVAIWYVERQLIERDGNRGALYFSMRSWLTAFVVGAHVQMLLI